MTKQPPTTQIEDKILATLKRPGSKYLILLGFAICSVLLAAAAWAYQIFIGLGVSGFTHPVMWALYITNFVFWVGIAHSGTLISAILYLFRAKWRTSISRAAEAMTVFAIMTAGLFPLIHLGRVWKFYYLLPYPNQRTLWINFKSPLIWDVFAVTTYFLVSLFFFYLGLIPDIALIRDRSTGIRKTIYSILSLGWSGSSTEWWHYKKAYLLLAGIATPLVVSVHSVVSWDFAMTIVPGWHSTIFAPYFVAGAVFSGTAMVITLLVPLRKAFHLEDVITVYNFENLAKILIFTSLIITYSYAMEFFMAWYSNNIFEQETFYRRAFGIYRHIFWFMLLCNSGLPLLFFFRNIRRNIGAIFVIAIFINIGMWLERFIIIVTSLAHDFDPAIWMLKGYSPTIIEYTITLGSIGFFLTLFLIFIKVFPAISISETKNGDRHDSAAGTGPAIPEMGQSHSADDYVSGTVPKQGQSPLSQSLRFGDSHAADVTGRVRNSPHLPESPVRFWTFSGGVIGLIAGFALTIWTSLAWPHWTGGKPVVSLPPFLIIAFELTLLFAGIGTILGFIFHSRFTLLPGWIKNPGVSSGRIKEQSSSVPAGFKEAGRRGRLVNWISFAMVTLGILAFLVGWKEHNFQRLWHIYHVNLLYWAGISIGCVVFSAVLVITKANWAKELQSIAMRFFPFFVFSLLLFLLSFFGRNEIYPLVWHRSGMGDVWFSIPRLYISNAVRWIVLSLLAGFFVRDFRRYSNTRSGSFISSAVILTIAYVVIIGFISIDLVMGLSPEWVSTLFGGYFAIGGFYSALAFIVLFALISKVKVDSSEFMDMGKLIFGFSLFWASLFWAQYLVIWYGNIPEETGFVFKRLNVSPWRILSWLIITLNFFIPFLLLLGKRAKANRAVLLIVSASITLGFFIERYILVIPSVSGEPLFGLLELFVSTGFLGAFLLCSFRIADFVRNHVT